MRINSKTEIIYTCIAFLSYLAVGIARGFPNYIRKQSLDGDILTQDDISWIASIFLLPNSIGSVIAGILMDQFGRISTIKISIGLFSASWLTIGLVKSNVFFIAFFAIGISVGMALTSGVYVAEICSDKNRSTLLSTVIVFFGIGVLVSYVVMYTLSWRNSVKLFALLFAFIFILLFFLEESPQWYVQKGKKEEAIRAFRKTRNIIQSEAEKEFEIAQQGITKKKLSGNYLIDLKQNWKPFSIVILFQILLTGSGFTIFVSYSSDIFQSISMPYDPNQVALTYSIALFVSSIFAPLATVYGGRRLLVILSGAGMTTVLTLMLLCIRMQLFCLIPIASYAYVFFCTTGCITVAECIPTELFKTEVRGFMCGISQAFYTVLQACVIKMFPFILARIGVISVLTVFGLFSSTIILFGFYVLPETKGKTLQEIQDTYFAPRSNVEDEVLDESMKNMVC